MWLAACMSCPAPVQFWEQRVKRTSYWPMGTKSKTKRWGRPAWNSGRRALGWEEITKSWWYSFLFFWLHCGACGILVLWPGIESATSALAVWQSLNPWTAGEVLIFLSKRSICRFRISRVKKKENSLSQDLNRALPLKANVLYLLTLWGPCLVYLISWFYLPSGHLCLNNDDVTVTVIMIKFKKTTTTCWVLKYVPGK